MSKTTLRVAAIGVTPPAYKASGGISAGLQLMRRVADRCTTTMYVMGERDETRLEGALEVTVRRAINPLRALSGIVPRQAITMSWRPAGLKSWLETQRPSIVHFHNPHPPGALAGAADLCNALGIPYVISTHGFVEFNDFSRGFGAPAWQRFLLAKFVREPVVGVARGAQRIFMLSPQESPILTGMGITENRLRVVTNGVDPYFLDEVAEEERLRLVRRFSLPTGVPLMLFVGNHTANKGLDVLLKSLPLMRTDAVAIVAGAIRSKSENARLVSESGMAANDRRFRFTDFITTEELRALYQSVDVFVFPSRADTLPLVILEAMASKLPVVATDVGGIPFEVTLDTGRLVSADDPTGLASALDSVCGDPDVMRRLGTAARDRVVRQFSWEQSADLAVSIYEDVIGRSA